MLLCSFHLNLKAFDGLFSIQFSQIICVHLHALNGFINLERMTSVRNVQRFSDRAPTRLHEEQKQSSGKVVTILKTGKSTWALRAADFTVCVNKAEQLAGFQKLWKELWNCTSVCSPNTELFAFWDTGILFERDWRGLPVSNPTSCVLADSPIWDFMSDCVAFPLPLSQ